MGDGLLDAAAHSGDSFGPHVLPSNSPLPSLFTTTAMIAATDTARRAFHTLSDVASIHRHGQSPSIGPLRSACTRSPISVHHLDTCLLINSPHAQPLHPFID